MEISHQNLISSKKPSFLIEEVDIDLLQSMTFNHKNGMITCLNTFHF
jgi:hypothetical protein